MRRMQSMSARGRVSGWWANKPPGHRGIVVAGGSLAALLLSLALALDATIGGEEDTMFPSLTGFVWDLAKVVVTGTLAFAVLSDLKGWGTAWRTMKVEEPVLRAAVHDFLSAAWANFGLNPSHLLEGRDLQGSQREVQECGTFFWRLHEVHSGLNESRLADLGLKFRGDRNDGQATHAITTWEQLLDRLGGWPLTDIDRSKMEAPFDSSLLNGKIDALRSSIQSVVADPATSTLLRTDAAEALVGLGRFEAGALDLHRWLGELARGGDDLLAQSSVGGMIPRPPVAVFPILRGFLGRLEAELALGGPSAQRYGLG